MVPGTTWLARRNLICNCGAKSLPRATLIAVSARLHGGTLMGPSPISLARSNLIRNTLKRTTTAATSRLKATIWREPSPSTPAPSKLIRIWLRLTTIAASRRRTRATRAERPGISTAPRNLTRNWAKKNDVIQLAMVHDDLSLNEGLTAIFLFTLKFDAAGNWKIVKTHQMSKKELEEEQ